jgi:hypothetical protein
MRFAFAYHFRVRFKRTQHFAHRVRVPLPHSLLGLQNHFLYQGYKPSQLPDLRFHRQHIAYLPIPVM